MVPPVEAIGATPVTAVTVPPEPVADIVIEPAPLVMVTPVPCTNVAATGVALVEPIMICPFVNGPMKPGPPLLVVPNMELLAVANPPIVFEADE